MLLNHQGVPATHTGFSSLEPIQSYRAEGFNQKIDVSFERGQFSVYTIRSIDELDAVLKLRYEIFAKEFQGRWTKSGSDFETLDLSADHLVIRDNKSESIVGTYRLVASNFSKEFYSSSEFDLSPIVTNKTNLLELSRACIHKDFRTGIILALLWRGISEYLTKVNAKYIFGCASVRTLDPSVVLDLSAELFKKGAILTDFNILPNSNYMRKTVTIRKSSSKDLSIPSLFQAYLHAGAKVSLIPAWDYKFKCVDFFTLLDTANMSRLFEKRYKK